VTARYIYLAKHSDGLIKVGRSQNPQQRIRHISSTIPTGTVELVCQFETPSVNAKGIDGTDFPGDTIWDRNAVLLEQEVLKTFTHLKVKGEWFKEKSLPTLRAFLKNHPLRTRRLPIHGFIGKSGYRVIINSSGWLMGYIDQVLPC
jgi:hypothetical protein